MPTFLPCGTFDLDRRVPTDPARCKVAYGVANVQGAQHSTVGGASVAQQVGRFDAGGRRTRRTTNGGWTVGRAADLISTSFVLTAAHAM